MPPLGDPPDVLKEHPQIKVVPAKVVSTAENRTVARGLRPEWLFVMEGVLLHTSRMKVRFPHTRRAAQKSSRDSPCGWVRRRRRGAAEPALPTAYGMYIGIGTWQVPATVNHLMVFVQNSGT